MTDQYISPTLNTNLARMLLESCARRLEGIYHLAGGERISRYDYACRLADAFGLDRSLIAPSKMAEAYGFLDGCLEGCSTAQRKALEY